MRNLNIIYLVLFIGIIVGCNSNKNELSDNFFNVKGLNFKVTSFEYLNDMGYKRIPEDILLFEKSNNDTILQLHIDDNLNTVIKKTWKVRLESDDKDFVQKTVFKHNAFLVTPIMDYSKGGYFFTVVRSIDNNVFLCKVKKENNIDYLYVDYYNPLRGRDLKKSVEMYEKWDNEQKEHYELNFKDKKE
jgi:hypothetical protein